MLLPDIIFQKNSKQISRILNMFSFKVFSHRLIKLHSPTLKIQLTIRIIREFIEFLVNAASPALGRLSVYLYSG